MDTFSPYLDSFLPFLVRLTVIVGELFSFILSSADIIGLKNVTFVSNKKSIFVEMFDFAVTHVNNFCKNELITVYFELFDGNGASLVLVKPER